MTRPSTGFLALIGSCLWCCQVQPDPAPSASPPPTLAAPEPTEPAQDPIDGLGPPRRSIPKTYRFNELQLSAFWIPGMWIESSEDSDIANQPGADLSTGSGLGARIGVGSQTQGLGILYTTTWHDENNTDTRAQTNALYFDGLARHQLTQGGIDVWFTAAASLGAAWIDFDTPVYDDEVGGAAQLRFMLDFQISRKVAFDAGMAGYVWGWPGDTGAYGAYLSIGGKLMF